MAFSNMFWNVQGAASNGFRFSFRTLIKAFSLKMVVLMETRISGAKADVFIKHNGFHCSHQMEAEGFSSGIWILWNNAYEVNIIWNHKQYIHFQVSENSSLISWVTAVYASPIPVIRKQLWQHLEGIAK